MDHFSLIANPTLNPNTNLVELVSAYGGRSTEVVPVIPPILLHRPDLARLFMKDPQTPDRWERKGWMRSIRRSSGRIHGYLAEEVAKIAARLAHEFNGPVFDECEAARLKLTELLTWVVDAVRTGAEDLNEDTLPVLPRVALGALAGDPSLLPKHIAASDAETHEQFTLAQIGLQMRLRNPKARQLMIEAWQKAGIILALDQKAGVVSRSH